MTIVTRLLSVRWTWRTVFAALCVLTAYLVPRIVHVSVEVTDLLEHLNLLGLALLTSNGVTASSSPSPSSAEELPKAGPGARAP